MISAAHRLILIHDSVRLDGWYEAPTSRRFSMSPSVPSAKDSNRKDCTCAAAASQHKPVVVGCQHIGKHVSIK